jgi:hypothetical protein
MKTALQKSAEEISVLLFKAPETQIELVISPQCDWLGVVVRCRGSLFVRELPNVKWGLA